MCRKHEGLEAAIDECRKRNIAYRFEQTTNQHWKFFVGNSPKWVLIGGINLVCLKKIRRDVIKTIALLTG